MEVAYYLSIILITLGLPALFTYVVIVFVKPSLTKKFAQTQWSRKKIGFTGVSSLAIGLIGLSLISNAVMPENIRAEMNARQEATVKAQQAEKNEIKKDVVTTKNETSTSSINFETSNEDDSTLAKGSSKVLIEGVNGEKTDTYEITYVNGKESSRKLVKSETTREPVTKVVANGTYEAPVQKAAPAQPKPAPTYQSSSAYYVNCTEARAAGVTPIYEGQPGYSTKLDRDRDGIACE